MINKGQEIHFRFMKLDNNPSAKKPLGAMHLYEQNHYISSQ